MPDDVKTDYTKPSSEKSESEKRQSMTKVIKGEAKVRKPSLGERIGGKFFAEDMRTISSHVFDDVVIPNTKDIILQVIDDSLSMLFFGDTSHSKNRSSVGSRFGSSYVETSYDKFYKDRNRAISARNDQGQRRSKAPPIDDIILERADAITALNQMRYWVQKFGFVTIWDYYTSCGITPSSSQDWILTDWGWTDLALANIRQVRGGYVIVMPEAEPLNA